MSTIISSSAVTLAPGLELLDSSDALIEDITDDLQPQGSVVERNNLAIIHGTCRLNVARELDWEIQRFRPYVTLTDQTDGTSQRWDLGVFLMETPQVNFGESPQTFQLVGYDKMVIAENPYGSTYRVASGAGYITTIETLLDELGEPHSIDQTDVAKTLPSARTWPIAQENTYRRIINDLLAAIGYRSLYVDRAGVFKSEPYTGAAGRSTVWDYNTGASDSIVARQALKRSDLFEVPNEWVFIRNDPEQALPEAGDGIYTVTNQSDGISSIDARGRTIRRVEFLDAADQSSLVRQGDRIAENDREPLVHIEFQSAPNPLHWHADVFTFNSPELGLSTARFSEQQWSLFLDGMDMRHVGRRVVS